ATLSHCWGGQSPDRLDTDTEKHLFSGRDLQDFCQLYQDVIHFVHSLGLQYIWIDSLCIFQGEKGDWHSQASQMAKIYKYSHVNIAASSAENRNQHLFDIK